MSGVNPPPPNRCVLSREWCFLAGLPSRRFHAIHGMDLVCRHWRIMLEKVADSARKVMKLAEPYKPYGGQFLEFCSISLSTYQTCMKLTRKSTEFCHFLPALSAKAYSYALDVSVKSSRLKSTSSGVGIRERTPFRFFVFCFFPCNHRRSCPRAISRHLILHHLCEVFTILISCYM